MFCIDLKFSNRYSRQPCGFTHVGNRTLIGPSSTILQRVNIGTDVTVASGSVVFAKVVDNPTMVNSARRMRAFEKK